MLIHGRGQAGAPAKAAMMEYMAREMGFNHVNSCWAGQCMRNNLQNFHTFDGLPCEVAQGNFEFFKDLSSTFELGHIDLSVVFLMCIQ